MVSGEVKWTTIRVSGRTKDALDSVKHPGQSYDGMIQELIKLWQRREELEKRGKAREKPRRR